jgi:hypothetical protein
MLLNNYVVKQTLTVPEIIYGLVSVFYGIPSVEEVLAGEILRISTGVMQILFGILFAMLSVLGIYALFDGLCRLIFNKTGIDAIYDFSEWIKKNI